MKVLENRGLFFFVPKGSREISVVKMVVKVHGKFAAVSDLIVRSGDFDAILIRKKFTGLKCGLKNQTCFSEPEESGMLHTAAS